MTGQILGIGTDLLDVARIARLLKAHPVRFLNRILTEAERAANPAPSVLWVAKRFAAKEAVAKACQTGIGAYVSFKDITISRGDRGAPRVKLSENAQKALMRLHSLSGPVKVHLSLSDEPPYVLAYAIVET